MRALVLVFIAAIAACATPNDAFTCTDSTQCKAGAGTCESTGFCSFADSTCSSGKRYGDLAGAGLGGQCYVNPNGDFDIQSATSTSNTSIAVTFSSSPDPAAAVVLANYSTNGLTLSGTPVLSGSTVTITTDPQQATMYTITAANITRASDAAPLVTASATFTGRAAFNVASAVSTTNISVQVVFDAPPDPASGATLGNYSIPGLTLAGTPVISGNTVTLTTSPQVVTDYMVMVSGVRRASDSEALTTSSATFTGRTSFNVQSAASLNSATVTVTFDAPPESVQATTLANYSIPGLTLSGTPTLSGNTVTLTTSAQGAQTYAVTVSNVTRASDAEPLAVASAGFSGINTFNVVSATAVTAHSVNVVFDAPPNPTQATDINNYSIPGLSLTGTPVISGNTVTLTSTNAQSGTTTYAVTVMVVTRASDAETLANTTAMFTGKPPFDLSSVSPASNTTLTVTFDAAPNMVQANTKTNYSIPGLTVTNASYSGTGNVVTLTTSSQSGIGYTLTVTGVTRASDAEVLTTGSKGFTGRTSFNVVSATPTSTTKINVLFDAPPTSGPATTATNYTLTGGLTVTGATLSGSTVTLTVSAPQSAVSYTLTVNTNVTRASDSEVLTVKTAIFTGRPSFNVASANAPTASTMTVTFDSPPANNTAVTTASNYVITGGGGLTLSNGSLSGNTVTFTTVGQVGGQSYIVTVSNVTRASDGEALTGKTAMFTGKTGFNVSSATAIDTFHVAVTFDATPNTSPAQTVTNYSIPGLPTPDTAVLSGSTVTLTFSTPMVGQQYTVTVSNVTRSGDNQTLSNTQANFTYTQFDVSSAAAVTSTSITVTYSAPPDSGATNAANYMLSSSLTITGTITLSGNTVTIPTSPQTGATVYTVTVAGVKRLSDGSVLTTTSAMFTGRASFNVTSAASVDSGTFTVTFDAAPDPVSATNINNYSVATLGLVGTPTLSGSTVTLHSAAQAGVTYTVTVTGVTRNSDGEPLLNGSTTFGGTALQVPVVTTVAVQSTVPNNSTSFYNTGTATVAITGQYFTGVSCPSGLALDDLDGAGNLVGTHPTSCTVNSDTSITATFPAGIRTNGPTGWDVKVTNAVGTNATSAQLLVVKAGLLISEVYTGTSGGGGNNVDQEYIELYNPTATSINVSTLGLKLHFRSAAGSDSSIPVIVVNTTMISHGFYLIVSNTTKSNESWYAHQDASYSPTSVQLIDNGAAYISLSATANSRVLDKIGWGTQPSPGYEGTAVANIPLDSSVSRKPAGGLGHATDTDNNLNDFNAATLTLTPRGSVDTAQP
jgi:predicted RNA-binding protein with TRAM domain